MPGAHRIQGPDEVGERWKIVRQEVHPGPPAPAECDVPEWLPEMPVAEAVPHVEQPGDAGLALRRWLRFLPPGLQQVLPVEPLKGLGHGELERWRGVYLERLRGEPVPAREGHLGDIHVLLHPTDGRPGRAER